MQLLSQIQMVVGIFMDKPLQLLLVTPKPLLKSLMSYWDLLTLRQALWVV